jgi:N-acetylmuramoyl-L-alanine amidase
MIFKCLKRENTPEPIEAIKDTPIKTAIIVGHNKKQQGALNYLGESEFKFNSRIAKKLQLSLIDNEFSSVVIYRPSVGGYTAQCEHVAKECEKRGITHAISLHFNSFEREVDGCEVLILNTETLIDNKLADTITDKLNFEFGIRERGKDGAVTITREDRGGTMLYELAQRGVVACIVEPIFANFRNNRTKNFFESEDKYVDLLSRSVREVLV